MIYRVYEEGGLLQCAFGVSYMVVAMIGGI